MTDDIHHSHHRSASIVDLLEIEFNAPIDDNAAQINYILNKGGALAIWVTES